MHESSRLHSDLHVDGGGSPVRRRVAAAVAWGCAGAMTALFLIGHFFHHAPETGAEEHAAPHLPPGWILGSMPFVLLLGAIAVLPLIPSLAAWWHRNINKYAVAMALAAATIAYLLMTGGVPAATHAIDHGVLGEFVPFITLLFALYVIAGGISVKGDLPARPWTNTGILAIGGAIASVVGTTGASMLLIRPLLQTNSGRKRVAHTVIFFIFIVSNAGGLLLPVGDPPLFLGYLRGVPFLWTLSMWPEWLMVVLSLLVIHHLFDEWMWRRERPEDLKREETVRAPIRIEGVINIVWLLLAVVCVAVVNPTRPLPGTEWIPWPFLREGLLYLLCGISLLTTPAGVRAHNHFNYGAILEVAALFSGIFIAMQVPLQVLAVKGGDLGLSEPWQFFWITGGLSSVLDNAPTYEVFFQTAAAITDPESANALPVNVGVIDPLLLRAVSLGAVFMGAMTYIGNGPNFMVKSIAEQSGVRMPSFFGYVVWSAVFLIPLYVVVTLIFL